MVNRLLEFKAVQDDAASDSNVALRGAAENGYLDVVNRLLEVKAVQDSATISKNWAYRDAAENGHVDVAITLVEHGVNPLCLEGAWQQTIEPTITNVNGLLIKFRTFSISEGNTEQTNKGNGSKPDKQPIAQKPRI